MTGAGPGRFDDLPPSAEYVYTLVDEHEPITRQQLLSETYLCETTLDRALDRLQNEHFIDKTRESGDLRQIVLTTRNIPTYNPSRD